MKEIFSIKQIKIDTNDLLLYLGDNNSLKGMLSNSDFNKEELLFCLVFLKENNRSV